MKWLKQFFSEADGKASYGRMASFLALLRVLQMAPGADNLESLGWFFLAVTSPYLGGKAADAFKARKE